MLSYKFILLFYLLFIYIIIFTTSESSDTIQNNNNLPTSSEINKVIDQLNIPKEVLLNIGSSLKFLNKGQWVLYDTINKKEVKIEVKDITPSQAAMTQNLHFTGTQYQLSLIDSNSVGNNNGNHWQTSKSPEYFPKSSTNMGTSVLSNGATIDNIGHGISLSSSSQTGNGKSFSTSSSSLNNNQNTMITSNEKSYINKNNSSTEKKNNKGFFGSSFYESTSREYTSEELRKSFHNNSTAFLNSPIYNNNNSINYNSTLSSNSTNTTPKFNNTKLPKPTRIPVITKNNSSNSNSNYNISDSYISYESKQRDNNSTFKISNFISLPTLLFIVILNLILL